MPYACAGYAEESVTYHWMGAGTLRAQIHGGAQAVGLELFTQKTSSLAWFHKYELDYTRPCGSRLPPPRGQFRPPDRRVKLPRRGVPCARGAVSAAGQWRLTD